MTVSLSRECIDLLYFPAFLYAPKDDYKFCLVQQPEESKYILDIYRKVSSLANSAPRDKVIYDLHTLITKIRSLTFEDKKNRVHAFYKELSRRVALYRNKYPKKDFGGLLLFQDIPQTAYRCIVGKLSQNDALSYFSASKSTYTIDRLSPDKVSKIVAKYYSIPEKKRKPSQIVNEVLQRKDYALDLEVFDTHINNLPLEILDRNNILLALIIEQICAFADFQVSIFNSLNAIALSKVKIIVVTSANDLTSQGLQVLLEKCPELEELNIWGCKNILDLDLSKVKPTKIKKIIARNTNLTSQGLQVLLEKCPELEKLDLSDCINIKDLDLSKVNPTKLKMLFASLSLTSQGLQVLLEKCPGLEMLSISDCENIQDLDLSKAASTKIKIIFAHSSALTSQGLQALLEKCPELEELYIDKCHKLQSRGPVLDLSKVSSTKLKKLKANESSITSQFLKAVLEKYSELEDLDISSCKKILDLDLSKVTSIKLKKLDASLSALTSRGLQVLLEQCPELEMLDISGCQNIKNLDLSKVASTKIRKLDARSSALTSRALKELLEKSPKLQELEIRDCKNLRGLGLFMYFTFTYENIESLIDRLQELKI